MLDLLLIELTLVVNKHGAKKVIRMRFDWCQGKERNPMCSLAAGKIWGHPPATGPEQSQFSAFCVYSAEGGARRTQPSSFGSTHAHFGAKPMAPRSMEATHMGLVI